MAPQYDSRLTRIAHEGFALIEDIYGGGSRTTRSPPAAGRHPSHLQNYQSQQLQPFIYHGPQISTVRIPVVVSSEVAQHHSGVAKQPPVMNSDEAAEYYGGMVIVEYGRRKHFYKD